MLRKAIGEGGCNRLEVRSEQASLIEEAGPLVAEARQIREHHVADRLILHVLL